MRSTHEVQLRYKRRTNEVWGAWGTSLWGYPGDSNCQGVMAIMKIMAIRLLLMADYNGLWRIITDYGGL